MSPSSFILKSIARKSARYSSACSGGARLWRSRSTFCPPSSCTSSPSPSPISTAAPSASASLTSANGTESVPFLGFQSNRAMDMPSPTSLSPSLSPSPSLSFSTLPSSSASLSSFAVDASCHQTPPPPLRLLDLMDHPDVYTGIPTSQLIRSLANLELIKHDRIVSLISSVLQSRAMDVQAFSRLLYAVVRRTTFNHFCAGETLEEAALSLQRNRDRGLRGILDHSVEDALNNESCDRNAQNVLHAIDTISQLVGDGVTHACVKMSAICPLPVLEHVSRLLRWKHVQNKSVSLPWLEPSLPIFAPESPIHIAQEPPPLSGEEEADLQRCMDRIRSICLACASQRNGAGLPLLIDAEYLSIQPAIDYIASVCMREFNESKPGSTISWRGADPPLVHTTVQAYLRDATARLRCALEGAEKAGVRYGVKLVRGAYMSKENALAQLAGVPSPIHPTIERTHEAYDTCVAMMIDRLANTHGSGAALVLATHNARSAANAVERAKHRLLPTGDVRIQFAQLKGMADRLSFALAKAGHLVTKYVPFGKIEEVVPYLVRRAEENKGIVGNTAEERAALWREIWRRLSLPSKAAG